MPVGSACHAELIRIGRRPGIAVRGDCDQVNRRHIRHGQTACFGILGRSATVDLDRRLAAQDLDVASRDSADAAMSLHGQTFDRFDRPRRHLGRPDRTAPEIPGHSGRCRSPRRRCANHGGAACRSHRGLGVLRLRQRRGAARGIERRSDADRPGTNGSHVPDPGHLRRSRLRVREPVDSVADGANLLSAVDRAWILPGLVRAAIAIIEISLKTPPVGLIVLVSVGVIEGVSTTTVFKGVTPFWIADLLRLVLLVPLPALLLILQKST